MILMENLMNTFEHKMLDILLDLKQNHNVVGVKAEFESEGTSFEEATRLKDIVSKAGLGFTIKIGGCAAVKDMYEVQKIGADVIVAPMIETPYALKKFVQSKNLVFSKDYNDIKFYINIETITGFINLVDIINSSDFEEISGIVLGRSDMSGSLNLTKQDVNSQEIFNMACKISSLMEDCNKEFIIGGGVSTLSIPFFKKIPYLSKFETRKIIFDANSGINNIDNGITKAIDFELLWLKNKQEFYNKIIDEDSKRILMLETMNNIK